MAKHRKPSNTKKKIQRASVVTMSGVAALAIATSGAPVAEASPSASGIVASAPAPVAPETPEVSEESYTVVAGDWLSKIASRVGMTTQGLYEANANIISDPDLIFPGQVLVVDDAPAEVPVAPVETATSSEGLSQAIIANSAGPVSPRTQAAANAVFTNVLGAQLITIGGTRSSARDPHGHPSGNALDYMVMSDGALGDAIVQYNIDHWSELGVEYIIWQQRIMTSPGGGWQGMEDRGSVTQNHYDHVHVNYN